MLSYYVGFSVGGIFYHNFEKISLYLIPLPAIKQPFKGLNWVFFL
jgi:hypothetical protein